MGKPTFSGVTFILSLHVSGSFDINLFAVQFFIIIAFYTLQTRSQHNHENVPMVPKTKDKLLVLGPIGTFSWLCCDLVCKAKLRADDCGLHVLFSLLCIINNLICLSHDPSILTRLVGNNWNLEWEGFLSCQTSLARTFPVLEKEITTARHGVHNRARKYTS